jgi:hypothetical protein
MKTLEELDCYMHFTENKAFGGWNGCLTRNHDEDHPRVNGMPNHIKCFVYFTKEECTKAATKWANKFNRQLNNFKG